MKLGMQVGLGPDHNVLDGDPAPPSQRGTAQSPIFVPYLLWPNCWIGSDATWYGGRPRPRRLCVRWGPKSPSQKWGGAPLSPIVGPCPLWPNGWMDQDDTWSRTHCARWGPAPLPQKWAEPSNFRSMSVVAKRLYAS